MFRHNWSVLCGRVIFDALTKTASLIDILDGISLPQNPGNEPVTVPLQPILVSNWILDDSDLRPSFRVEILDPNGTKVMESIEFQIRKDPSGRPKTVVGLPMLQFSKVGTYNFVVKVKEKVDGDFIEVERVPLDVAAAPPPSTPQNAGPVPST